VADAPRRRLPVLQSGGHGDGDGDGEERPPWHWVGFGTVAIFAVWLPLAVGATALVRRALPEEAGAETPPSVRALMVGLHALAFVIATGAGGFLVGRYGEKAGRREATGSGLLAAAMAWALGISQGAQGGALVWALLLVLMATLGGGAAHAGGRMGLRRRTSGRQGRP
jgi:tRNA-(ms[2]io[6]A)-hydroxylase